MNHQQLLPTSDVPNSDMRSSISERKGSPQRGGALIMGRAETSRILFAIAGVEYEDIRISPADKSSPDGLWNTQVIPNAPFGQVPLLNVDGKLICQSRAIERYLARQFGLAGKSAWDQARVDMIVDCIEDFRAPQSITRRETDEAKKSKMKKEYVEDKLPKFLDNFEKILKENNGGDGYFVGDELTFADISFYHHSSCAPDHLGKDVVIDWDKYPKLKALRNKVENFPRVNEWLKKRPVTAL